MNSIELKTKADELAGIIDDETCDALESLYFGIISALTGKSADDLWKRYNELYEGNCQPDTGTVSMVGHELGFPPMWDIVEKSLEYMADSRKVPSVPSRETAAPAGGYTGKCFATRCPSCGISWQGGGVESVYPPILVSEARKCSSRLAGLRVQSGRLDYADTILESEECAGGPAAFTCSECGFSTVRLDDFLASAGEAPEKPEQPTRER